MDKKHQDILEYVKNQAVELIKVLNDIEGMVIAESIKKDGKYAQNIQELEKFDLSGENGRELSRLVAEFIKTATPVDKRTA